MNSAALSLAASMFEGSGAEGDNLADTDTELYILGIKYRTPNDTYAVLDDVVSRFWFTYRTGFAPIGGPSGPTKDTGWGCMMRCGQMMLAEGYLRFFLPAGRYFRWRPNMSDKHYWDILNMFIDKRHSSYSIHQIVQMGNSEGKDIGQWFGPNTIAQVLRRIASNEFEKQINVHVAMDNTLVLSEIRALCQIPSKVRSGTKKSNETPPNTWRPLVIIIPLRLGLSDVNTEYIDQLKLFRDSISMPQHALFSKEIISLIKKRHDAYQVPLIENNYGYALCFRLPQTLGCIGGKPNHAHYFIGYLESDELLYLDPHVTQTHADTTAVPDDTSYHCDRVNRMKFSGLDPSLALAFACKTEVEFNDLIAKLREHLPRRPMFEICESNPFDIVDKNTAHHEVLTLDSDDDFEVV